MNELIKFSLFDVRTAPYSHDGGGAGKGRHGAQVGRIRSAKRPLILPNGYIAETIVKELVLGEEYNTTESEPEGSEELEMRSGEENGLEDQMVDIDGQPALGHTHTRSDERPSAP